MVACSQRKVIYLVLLGCLAGFLVVHFEGAGFTTMKVSIHDEVGKLRARVKSLSSALEQEIVARKGGTQGVAAAAAAAAARIPSGSPADTEAALTRAYPLSRSRSTPEQTKGGTSSSSSPSSSSEITAASSPFGDTPRSKGDVYGDLAAAARYARTGGLCGVVHGNSEVPMAALKIDTEFLTLHAKHKRLFFVPVRAEDAYSDAEWDKARTGHFDEAYFIVYVVASNTHANGGYGLPPPRNGTMLVAW